ncbi:hypothetical protein [Halomarina pelagica]|uniref:hypothetical protein n=1 Tax=Halomarina pelagica TaxID=2961599 RepID=UPI0020C53FB8|nr:hypothetical protein [Halomarina sp. BND7]
MTTDETTPLERTDDQLAARDVRALTDYLLVVEDAPDLYLVYGEGGDEYTVDTRTGACTCPDYEYRQPAGGCKHIRRVAFETGARDVPAWANRDAMDPLLVKALDEQERERVEATPEPRVATDGGLQTAPAPEATETEIEPETDQEPPMPGYTYHVEAPAQGAARYVRCEGCGRELLTSLGGRNALLHTEECPNENNGRT